MPEITHALRERTPLMLWGVVGTGVGLIAVTVATMPTKPPESFTLQPGDNITVCDNSYVVPTEITPGRAIKNSFDIIVRPVIYKDEVYGYSSSPDQEVRLRRIDTPNGYWLSGDGKRTAQSTCHKAQNIGRIFTHGMIFLSTEAQTARQIGRITGEGSACEAGAYALWYGMKSQKEVQQINSYCPHPNRP
ncbi:MAG TPA: hypothetical protein VFI74_06020 [Candidatus Saccharimonadales bacterium]|nr:hypothetical protein [Candidatus Saccharimonadales bacterium]